MTDNTDTIERSPPTQAEGDELRLLLIDLQQAVETLCDAVAPKLFYTDTQIIKKLGVPEKVGYMMLRSMDENPHSGFPEKHKIWGDRRYWPDVVAYFDETCRRKIRPSSQGR